MRALECMLQFHSDVGFVLAELIRGDVFYWGQLMAGALLGSGSVKG
jgi:hypothetical protein